MNSSLFTSTKHGLANIDLKKALIVTTVQMKTLTNSLFRKLVHKGYGQHFAQK